MTSDLKRTKHKGTSKGAFNIPSADSLDHLLATIFHRFLQMGKGYVERVFLTKDGLQNEWYQGRKFRQADFLGI